MTLRKFEQSAILVETANAVFAVDFGNLTPTQAINDFKGTRWTLVTHIHPDHFDAANLRKRGVPIYGPLEVADAAAAAGLIAHRLAAETQIVLDEIALTPFIVNHGNISAPIENFGYLIECEGKRLLFLGDMAVPGEIPAGTFDLVLTPVGGGKVFTAAQAADFIRSIGHARLVVPLHFHGRADPNSARAFEKEIGNHSDVRILAVGESMEVQ